MSDTAAPRLIELPRTESVNARGQANGWVVSFWKDWENFLRYPPRQVYVNCCRAGEQKGPHLHKTRSGTFIPLNGRLLFVARHEGKYIEFLIEPQDGRNMKAVEIPPGVPCCIYNVGGTDALFINMPSPAWHPDRQDNNPVENWDYTREKQPR